MTEFHVEKGQVGGLYHKLNSNMVMFEKLREVYLPKVESVLESLSNFDSRLITSESVDFVEIGKFVGGAKQEFGWLGSSSEYNLTKELGIRGVRVTASVYSGYRSVRLSVYLSKYWYISEEFNAQYKTIYDFYCYQKSLQGKMRSALDNSLAITLTEEDMRFLKPNNDGVIKSLIETVETTPIPTKGDVEDAIAKVNKRFEESLLSSTVKETTQKPSKDKMVGGKLVKPKEAKKGGLFAWLFGG